MYVLLLSSSFFKRKIAIQHSIKKKKGNYPTFNYQFLTPYRIFSLWFVLLFVETKNQFIVLPFIKFLISLLINFYNCGRRLLMTKFDKYTKPFSSKKVVSKIVSTWIIVSTRQSTILVCTLRV